MAEPTDDLKDALQTAAAMTTVAIVAAIETAHGHRGAHAADLVGATATAAGNAVGTHAQVVAKLAAFLAILDARYAPHA